MSQKEKRVILSIVGVIILIFLIAVIVKGFGKKEESRGNNVENTQTENVANEEKYTTTLEDGTKLNDSQEFHNVKKFKQLEISNIQFTSNGGNSVFLADVKNTGSTTHEPEIVVITILGENNEVITTLETVIDKIEPGKTEKINTVVTADFANAKDFKIEAK